MASLDSPSTSLEKETATTSPPKSHEAYGLTSSAQSLVQDNLASHHHTKGVNPVQQLTIHILVVAVHPTLSRTLTQQCASTCQPIPGSTPNNAWITD